MDREDGSAVETRGPGPFLTHQLIRHPSGGHLVVSSRRHRKGLGPHWVSKRGEANLPRPTDLGAFRHVWAPRRFAWWVAVLFAIGATHFLVGGVSSAWPGSVPRPLRDPGVQNAVFFVGSLFFTSAAWCQWLEVINRDVAFAFHPQPDRTWRWFAWRPRNLGYLASTVQLVGTLWFNVNTADAAIAHLSGLERDLVVWTPNMLGCLCFLVASGFAFAEVSQGTVLIAPRSVSWWIAVINLVGSVAFQASALYSFAGPTPASVSSLVAANLYTALGALCFLVGAYLMIPELFDGEPAGDSPERFSEVRP